MDTCILLMIIYPWEDTSLELVYAKVLSSFFTSQATNKLPMTESRVAMEGESTMPMEIALWLKGVSHMPIEYAAHLAYMVPTNSINSYGTYCTYTLMSTMDTYHQSVTPKPRYAYQA